MPKQIYAVTIVFLRGEDEHREVRHDLAQAIAASKNIAIAFVVHELAAQCPATEGWRVHSVLAALVDEGAEHQWSEGDKC